MPFLKKLDLDSYSYSGSGSESEFNQVSDPGLDPGLDSGFFCFVAVVCR